MLLDANFGFTHQVLGAEAPDIDVNIGLDADKMNIPGHQRSGPPAGRPAKLPDRELGQPRQRRHRQPVPVPRQAVHVQPSNLQNQRPRHRVPRRARVTQDQQINHFQPQGGTFQTVRGTFLFNGQATMLQNAPAPADARFNSLGGVPARPAVAAPARSSSCVNPNSIYMKTYAAYVQDTWQVDARPDAGARTALGAPALADAGPTARASTGSIRPTATSMSAARAAFRRTRARAPSGLFLPRAGR